MNKLTLDEAIEGLTREANAFRELCPDSNLVAMHQLGVEALEFVKKGRDYPEFPSELLPSEGE